MTETETNKITQVELSVVSVSMQYEQFTQNYLFCPLLRDGVSQCEQTLNATHVSCRCPRNTLLAFHLQPPESPGEGWDLGIREWDASYYRPACPQEIWEFDDRFYEVRNQSEDCLHLNIFQPNVSSY